VYENGKYERGKDGYWNSRDGSVRLNIQFDRQGRLENKVMLTVPRVLCRSNYTPANESETREALQKAERTLFDEAGVRLDIHAGRISRIDVPQNAVLEHGLESYKSVFGLLGGSRMRDRDEYKNGYRISSEERQYVFYDKRKELVATKQSIAGVPPNVMRFEPRWFGFRQVGLFSRGTLDTAGDIVSDFGLVTQIYKRAYEDVFKYTARDLDAVYGTADKQRLAAELRWARSTGGRYWGTRFESTLSVQRIFELAGSEDGLREVLQGEGLSKQEISRRMKRWRERRFEIATRDLLPGARVSVGALYGELKTKLAA
jgi:hypothetical protein